MDILMIGNGFDLEHGLPTQYKDFLKFIGKFEEYDLKISKDSSEINNITEDYFTELFSEKRPFVKHSFRELIKDNRWIAHFKYAYENHLKYKENWIDFESEISDVIQDLEEAKKFYQEAEKEENEKELSAYIADKLILVTNPTLDGQQYIKDAKEHLLYDLDRLVCALEIYIWDYVGRINIEYFNPNIAEINPYGLISFNYSDTYRNVYADTKIYVKCDFIHGKAKNNINYPYDLKRIIDSNNMVLGIDEYLDDDRKNKEIDFIAFKKYYQRIHKQTGNKYKDWLELIDKAVEAGRKEENNLYIFGHSLDDTDGDILRDILKNENIKTTIFYKDKEKMGQQITNLVKVIKCDEVIKRVYGNSPNIIFKRQSERERIVGSSFEITSDSARLKRIFDFHDDEANILCNKIGSKIYNKDLDYFFSQEKAISLYDVLQKVGCEINFEKKLFEITCELLEREKTKEPLQYSEERWAYQDYDKLFACDIKTVKFIDKVNKYNRKNYKKYHPPFENLDVYMEEVTLICSEDSVGKEKYQEVLDKLFNMFSNPYANIELLWKKLLDISVGPAKTYSREYLKKIIANEEKVLNQIHYSHLLDLIIEQEYWDNEAQNDYGEVEHEDE